MRPGGFSDLGRRVATAAVALPLLLAGLLLGPPVLAVAIVSVPFLMLSPTGLPRLRNLEEERRQAKEEISRLGSQITALRAEVARIKSDPAAVERAARDELGLVRTTEVVFQFSE